MTLNREQLLKPVSIPREKVELPELGGSIWIRGMSAADRSKFENNFQTASGKSNKRKMAEVRERLLVACCCTEDGSPMLTEKDIEALGKQPIHLVERMVTVAQRLCGMSNEDVELLAKNSEETGETS